MNLYQIHDDPRGVLLWDETTWMAVWADAPEDAFALYKAAYEGDPLATIADVKIAVADTAASPEKAGPHEESRPWVLRLLGWHLDGESRCDVCGLASMGASEYRVCESCLVCRECGCDCNGKD